MIAHQSNRQGGRDRPAVTRLRLVLGSGVLLAGMSAVAWAQIAYPYNNEQLQGTQLATLDVSTPGDCQTACEKTEGCTGFNFAGPLGGSDIVPPQVDIQLPDRPVPAANCTLMTGKLETRFIANVQSCRMPCTGEVKPNDNAYRDGVIPFPEGRQYKVEPRDIPKREIRPEIKEMTQQGPVAVGVGTTIKPRELVGSIGKAQPGDAAPPPAPLTGFEIVRSGQISVAPLSSGTVSATCSPGKVAISVGYIAAPANSKARDAGRGLEIKSAMPDAGSGTVTLRNANVFERATLQAIATCIDPVPGMRPVSVTNGVQGPDTVSASCKPDERVIGGGFETEMDGHPRGSFPLDNGWQVDGTKATPLPGRFNFTSRVFCAPANAVAGWQPRASSSLGLGAQSDGSQSVACPSGLTAIAGGIDGQAGSNALAMISNSLEPNGSGWTASVWNRDTVAGPGSVSVRVAAICAQVN